MAYLYEGKYKKADKEFKILVGTLLKSVPPDNSSSNMFIDFFGLDIKKQLEHYFPEFRNFLEEDDFIGFFRKLLLPHFLDHLKIVIKESSDQFNVCKFPFTLKFFIVAADNEPSLFWEGQTDFCLMGIKAQDLLFEVLVEKYKDDPKRSSFVKSPFFRSKFRFRTLQGLKSQTLSDVLKHELNHFFHYCVQINKDPDYHKKHLDPYYLHAEAITTLKDARNKVYLIYPSANKFKEYLSKEEKNYAGTVLHQYSLYIAFFIGLALMKKEYKDRYDQQIVRTRKKEKISLAFVNFKDLLQEKNRPLYFKNLPQDINDILFDKLLHLTPNGFVNLYLESAKYLRIPKKHFLVGRRILKKKKKGPFVFSS
jgi:hypothetical protein